MIHRRLEPCQDKMHESSPCDSKKLFLLLSVLFCEVMAALIPRNTAPVQRCNSEARKQ